MMEEILLVSRPLPSPSIVQMQGGKHAQRVFELLFKCASEVLLAIVTYVSDGESPVLWVGGILGLFPGFQALEFLQCYVQTVDKDPSKMMKVNTLLLQYDTTLAKEAWRQWVILSFAQSKYNKAGLLYEAWLIWMETVMWADTTDNEWYRMERSNVRPKIVDDIAQIATRRVRPIQTDDFGIPYANEPWGTTEIRMEVQVWVTKTGDMDFKGASVLDVFLWTYSLYMVCGHGRESESEWCHKALEMSIQGLLDASKEHELTILEERRELIIATIEPKVEKKVKGAKRNGRKIKDIGPVGECIQSFSGGGD
ncbi:hypothetical protein M422DRAFT_258677 [Sphaerobolus stellatus SS14]|uniref:Uncharacterized protein n=1 Tax=Sphaerobolus stellatus (strain SS14) TaxID=990650 RepID=A0A0C9VL80_SPHS4|nr:hypothetical protein M422DRAFT_258677 [Sphaerobolus stellatus SS14]